MLNISFKYYTHVSCLFVLCRSKSLLYSLHSALNEKDVGGGVWDGEFILFPSLSDRS